MHPAATVCWRFDLFGWPCLSQSEWASWIQVIAAVVGIALALYIPVRMKRLDDLERMRAAVSRLETLRRVARRFVSIFDDPKNHFPGKAEIETSKAACEAMVQDSATDALFIPALGKSIEAARKLHVIWQYVATGGAHRTDQKDIALKARDEIEEACGEAEILISKWKRKHWLALLMHG